MITTTEIACFTQISFSNLVPRAFPTKRKKPWERGCSFSRTLARERDNPEALLAYEPLPRNRNFDNIKKTAGSQYAISLFSWRFRRPLVLRRSKRDELANTRTAKSIPHTGTERRISGGNEKGQPSNPCVADHMASALAWWGHDGTCKFCFVHFSQSSRNDT